MNLLHYDGRRVYEINVEKHEIKILQFRLDGPKISSFMLSDLKNHKVFSDSMNTEFNNHAKYFSFSFCSI